MGTFVGGGRHCNGAARDDVGNDLMSGVTGEDYIWSFGVVREHPTDFFAGAEAYYAAYKSVESHEIPSSCEISFMKLMKLTSFMKLVS